MKHVGTIKPPQPLVLNLNLQHTPAPARLFISRICFAMLVNLFVMQTRCTPLHTAALLNHTQIAAFLLGKGAAIDALDDVSQISQTSCDHLE